MRRHRRRTASEINLTPLLDVLFSILFIVMMTGVQNEAKIEEGHRQQMLKKEQEISALAEQAARYEKQISEYEVWLSEYEIQLSDYANRLLSCESQMSSYDTYRAEAVIVTVNNILEEEAHYLVMKQGLEQKEVEKIRLGTDKTENTKTRIDNVVAAMVEATDNQPVYIVFYCNKEWIYTAEYRAVEEAFSRLQETYKEVFFKVMEEQMEDRNEGYE